MSRFLYILLFILFFSVASFAAEEYGMFSDKKEKQSEDSVAISRSFDYFYHQALLLKEQERFDEAFSLFEYCLGLQPNSPVVMCELYSMYMYLGRKSEALEMVRKATLGDSDNFWYHQLLAAAYENEGMRSEAIAQYETIAERFTSHSELYYKLAMMYIEEGDYKRALTALDKLERIEGKSENITLQKFRIYTLMQQKDSAMNELHALIDEYPDDMRLKVMLAENQLQFNDTVAALGTFDEVLAADPENVEAQMSLTDFYRLSGNDSLFTVNMERLLMNEKFTGEERQNAIIRFVGYKERNNSTEYNFKLFERLISLPFEQAVNADAYANFLVYKNVGADTLMPVLGKLLQYEPENKLAHLKMIEIAIKRNDLDEIIARCDTAILYNPELLQLYYYRGLVYYQKESYNDAIRSFEKGIQVRGEEYDDGFVSDIYGLIGDAYHTIGKMDACYQAYDSALVYNSENISVYNNYAYFLSLEGKELERAEEMSYRTIKAEPENSIYIDTYMWVLFCLGRYDEAKAYAEKLISLQKNDMGAVELHHCGDIFAKCGDIEKAVEFWSRALNEGDTSKVLKKKIKKRKYISDGKKK